MNYRYGTNPAELKHRATFLKPPGQIVGGWPSTDWTEHVTVWAALETQKGYKVFNSDATQWQDKKVVGIRYRKDISEDMHVVINGITHEIESLTNDNERNQWLTIIVREVL